MSHIDATLMSPSTEARAVLDDVLNPHKVERNSAEDILCTSELLLQKKLSEMVDLQTAEKEAATRAEKRGETEFLQTFPKMVEIFF